MDIKDDLAAIRGRWAELSVGYAVGIVDAAKAQVDAARAALELGRGFGKTGLALTMLPSLPLRARGWKWRR